MLNIYTFNRVIDVSQCAWQCLRTRTQGGAHWKRGRSGVGLSPSPVSFGPFEFGLPLSPR